MMPRAPAKPSGDQPRPGTQRRPTHRVARRNERESWSPRTRAVLSISAALLLGGGSPSYTAAGITASLSKEQTDIGQPVVLSLSSTKPLVLEPDLSPLQADFRLLDRSRVSDLEEINGRRREQHSLLVTLLPKRSGEILIPPLEVDAFETPPLRLLVLADETRGRPNSDPSNVLARDDGNQADVSSAAPAAPAPEIAIQISLEPQRVLVGQQMLLRLLVTGDGPLPPGRLIPPKLEQADLLPLGETARGGAPASISDGATKLGRWELEQHFAIFPRAAGTLNVPPAQFEAWGPGASAPVRHQSAAVQASVEPAPSPPPGLNSGTYDASYWLPASQLSLSEAGASRVQLAPGQAIERMVTLKAVGLPAEALPAIPLAIPFQLQVRADPPRLWNLYEPTGVTGYRAERITISTEEPGTYRLPAATITWWDVNQQQWSKAELPAWELVVAALDVASRRPTPDWRRAPLLDQASPERRATNDASSEPSSRQSLPIVWGGLMFATAAIVLGALGWFFWSRRRNRDQVRPASDTEAPTRATATSNGVNDQRPTAAAAETARIQDSQALDRLHAAYRQADAEAARQALLDWGRTQWPERSPNNLAQLASRLEAPIADEIRQLDKAFFSPKPIDWHSAPLPDRLAERSDKRSKVEPTTASGRDGAAH